MKGINDKNECVLLEFTIIATFEEDRNEMLCRGLLAILYFLTRVI